MPTVNPTILKWARQTAGLNEADAAEKLGIKRTKTSSPIERLQALESGEEIPSRPMLVKMAKRYRRSILVFYLAEVPQRGERGEDYRTLPASQQIDEAILDALIRDVQVRQSLIRLAILDEEGEEEPLEFVGSMSMKDGVDSVVESIHAVLGMTHEQFRDEANPSDAFQFLRRQIEANGIFVLLLGNLGSHHTNLDVETFRGFALSDNIAPFIVINDSDNHAAWSFTALHELTHIWLGQTGVSGNYSERAIEQFCNDVASEFLFPTQEMQLLSSITDVPFESIIQQINDFAFPRNISRSMVAYKLFRHGQIDESTWQRLRSYYRERWYESRVHRKEQTKPSSGGPNYYIVRRHRLGQALLGATAEFMQAGSLTTTQAGQVLGVKPKNVQRLLAREAI